ncbi:hypothetical protein LYZ77_17465 [Xanthomonas hortorum pv. vitians]|uniref:hypothetical protein n=2 Tax=Xanthomonas hortorum TaxID=56454 RepID=UPI001784CD8B|nr:hypothetical protein [Xanthomonas hortorum]MCE4280542.1 hypothetical protein [Xanthomonas hortorum pv. vitians]MCE4286652.1 hypothetical protein [Xanthomonas hortorum pv. vitians]MCE4291182.1 hypothetical protein [Xanthomonas hortorum pv. vitians]MCE4295391.1 hypothetical protein [Xanthomonas hortorum pv. vitians]
MNPPLQSMAAPHKVCKIFLTPADALRTNRLKAAPLQSNRHQATSSDGVLQSFVPADLE